eukprot:6213091-Pleurochrysis_carterae.AAC.3
MDAVHLKNTKSVLFADLQDKYCRKRTDAAKTNVNSLFVYIGAGIIIFGAGFSLYGTLQKR